MGVRPPTGDTSEPETVTFGIAALDGRLEEADVEFPATVDDLQQSLGNVMIPYDPAGNEMPLTSALERTNRREFESRQELLNALHPVFEQRRSATSSSVLGQLRTLLPF